MEHAEVRRLIEDKVRPGCGRKVDESSFDAQVDYLPARSRSLTRDKRASFNLDLGVPMGET